MHSVFVLCQNYPSEKDKYSMAFVHPRIKEYLKTGLDVKVISFACNCSYIYDEVQVYTLQKGKELLRKSEKVILIAHAPNIKNHLFFILKTWKYLDRLILFFHGHEVLSTKKYYPRPYDFNKAAKREYRFLRLYYQIKLPVMRYYLKKFVASGKCDLVFVSDWMYEAAIRSLKLKHEFFTAPSHIINNSISPYIKEAGYVLNDFKADFITIRPLDQSKYAIDLVVNFAKCHPESTFHIYGGGNYFNYTDIPANVTLINRFLSPIEIPRVLNSYKYALMPTRLDAQGVMMCEMAVYGIPTIVSDIAVCHEMLDSYPNVLFIDNNRFDCRLNDIPEPLVSPDFSFSVENTIHKEIELIQKYL